MESPSYVVELTLTGQRLAADTVTFIINMQPRVSYAAGDVLKSGFVAERGKWQAMVFTSVQQDAAMAVRSFAHTLVAQRHALVEAGLQVAAISVALSASYATLDLCLPTDVLQLLHESRATFEIRTFDELLFGGADDE